MSKESDALLRFVGAAKDLVTEVLAPEVTKRADNVWDRATSCSHPMEYVVPKIVVNDLLTVASDPAVADALPIALRRELTLLRAYVNRV